MSDTPLPCPFCGAEPEWGCVGDGDWPRWDIGCSERCVLLTCGWADRPEGRVYFTFRTEAEAIAAWNRRAPAFRRGTTWGGARRRAPKVVPHE